MENTVKVSIIIPVYNAEKYLRESLDCLISQTFSDFEVICVDDGSSDNSLKILCEYAAKDSRFSVFTQDHAFAGTARNLGITHARGDYLIFLDADDYFLPKMLESSLKKAEENDADICVFSVMGFNNVTNKTYPMPWMCQPESTQQYIFSKENDPDHIFCFTSSAPWNKLYKRSFITENNLFFQNIRSANDFSFVMTALAAASRIVTLDEPLLIYRTNNDSSLQGSQQKDPLSFYFALQELRKQLYERELYDFLERAFINQAAGFIFYNLHTLKSPLVFETTYFAIKEKILPDFRLSDYPDNYYFVMQDWNLPERIKTVSTESIFDYYIKFKVNFPELYKYQISHMSWKDITRQNLSWIRSHLIR